jgi:molybdopterin-guanine dinucleotide biosynthesis protein A
MASPSKSQSVVDGITGVVLAGGRARRMGGADKGLITLNDKPMVEYVLEGLAPQVDALVINANRNLDLYAQYGVPVQPDLREGYLGPLAGIASAMEIADKAYLLTTPCDSPFVPDDLAQRLLNALRPRAAEIAVAQDGERMQPVFALLRTDLLESLRSYLDSGQRKIDHWFERHRCITVDFSDWPDAFINVNTPEDRTAVELRLKSRYCRI